MRHNLLLSFLILPALLWAMADNTALPPANPPPVQNIPAVTRPEQTTLPRGQLLYEHHCTSCHTSVAHLREHHKAKSRADITVWVNKWASYQKLSWSNEEIDAVVDYLDATFYKFTQHK